MKNNSSRGITAVSKDHIIFVVYYIDVTFYLFLNLSFIFQGISVYNQLFIIYISPIFEQNQMQITFYNTFPLILIFTCEFTVNHLMKYFGKQIIHHTEIKNHKI